MTMITNSSSVPGQPILIRAAMKPIATTLNPQRSVDLAEGVAVETRYERSDFCPVPRAVVIVEAMLAYVLADALLEKLGGDWGSSRVDLQACKLGTGRRFTTS
jgi:chorismate synthase (EC 4.2.3.5)